MEQATAVVPGKAQRSQRMMFLVISVAFSSFMCIAVMIHQFVPGDYAITAQYDREVSPIAYLMPALAFGTALLLNTLTLAVERSSVKMQMTLIVCYINLLAALTDYMGYLGLTPVIRDPWGQGVVITRLVMWLWTTPAMVYLLGLISDMSQKEVFVIVGTDAGMLTMLILAVVQPSQLLAVLFIACAISLYVYSIRGVWRMFQAPINSAGRGTSAVSLQVVRVFTVVMWSCFIVIFMSSKTRLISVRTEEWLWGVFDFLGKAMFSSSLLQSNFITMEERRLHAMKLVEEGRREQVIQELTSLVQQKEQFMSSMSHELRTPLNGIIGLSDALLIGCCGELTEVSHKTIGTIKSSGLRLLNLINDILDAASMQHGKLIIRHERVKLDRLVDDVMDLLKPLAKKEVRLLNDVPATMPAVLGDTGRLMQIFHNLVGNACKFTHSGSIAVNAILKMDEVEVAVADTGIGIPREKFEDVFKAFSQVDMSTTRQYGGTGLGLTLVKQLVEAHGGVITVKSKIGVGTTFYLSFKVWDPTIHAEDVSKVMTPTDIEVTKQRVGRMMSILNMKTGSGKANPTAAATGGAMDEGAAKAAAAAYPSPEKPGAVRRAHSSVGVAARPSAGASMPPLTPVKSGSPGSSTPAATVAPNSPAPAAPTAPATVGRAAAAAAAAATSSRLAKQQSTGQALPLPGTAAGDDDDELRRARPAAGSDDGGDAGAGKSAGQKSVGWAEDGPGAASGGNSAAGGDAEAGAEGDDGAEMDGRSTSGKQFHVLSVDDDDVNQMVIERWLTPKGFLITKAMDGQEALRILKELDTLPDIILLDVMMPGMDGYEVCRRLRELYPNSCVPVIMVSAKSKEEDVVQGLAVGANDYIVKPYGRKELLARIQAHLRYRTKVIRLASEGVPESDKKSRLSDNLVELLCAESKAFSLPASIKSKVENSTGVSAPLQVYDDLTMIVIGINNLDVLTAGRGTSMPELLGSLASLFILLEDLLLQYSAYIVDCMEDKLVIVTGLSGDRLGEQACNAVDLCSEVQKLAATLMPGGGSNRLLLSAGIHCWTATAAIVGVQHPVLQVTGALAEKATQLQATCPPGCVHVSKRVYELCARPDEFAPALHTLPVPASDASFLHHSGPWEAHLAGMAARFDRYMSSHPFGPINSTALRWRPVQRAMLCLIQADVARLVELLSGSSQSKRQRQQQRQVQEDPQDPGLLDSLLLSADLLDGRAPEAAVKLVTKLQLDKEELQRQLEHKTTDTDRLQVMVDNLQLDVYGLEALQAQLNTSNSELNKFKDKVSLLQRQLLAAHASTSGGGASEGPPASPPRPQVPGGRNPPPRGVSGVGHRQSVLSGLSSINPQSLQALQGAVGQPRISHAGTDDDRETGFTSTWMSRHDTTGLDDLAVSAKAGAPTITEFLATLGMPHLAPIFVREEITPDMLPYIHDATLLQLGVTSVGDLVRIRRAAQAL